MTAREAAGALTGRTGVLALLRFQFASRSFRYVRSWTGVCACRSLATGMDELQGGRSWTAVAVAAGGRIRFARRGAEGGVVSTPM